VAGVVIGVAGTIYATNEEVRKNLPKAARDLPDNVRRRYRSAVSAAREASARRREEILRDLEEHGGNHAARGARPDPDDGEATGSASDETTTEVSTQEPEQR
jgi:uncharacterized membrane protein YccC